MNPLPENLRHLYPFGPLSFATPSGARMSFVDAGPRSDAAVLMLHGNPTWSFYYARLIQRLAHARRCVAPDHVGMGLSEKPPAALNLENRVADILALVETLALKKLDLVLHDWGGAIGLGLATRRPELVNRIVLLNTAAFPLPRIPLRIALCKTRALGPFLVRSLNAFARPATWMAMRRRRLSTDEKHALLFPYRDAPSRAAIAAFVRDIPMSPRHPSWNTLNSIADNLPLLADKPVHLHWAGADFCFNRLFLDEWRRRFPNASVAEYPDAGHYLLLDADAEILPRLERQLVP
ncbi:MAG: alpha/beta fold hydrolase [Opitutaceae bacterium]|jgi:haloalkane dehalogenase|nr:alpha/beta fold hydrolase [Opitutaceae bacterium]